MAMACSVREQALRRLAVLSASSSPSAPLFDKSDLDKLCRAGPNRAAAYAVAGGHNGSLPRPGVGQMPMVSIRLPIPVLSPWDSTFWFCG